MDKSYLTETLNSILEKRTVASKDLRDVIDRLLLSFFISEDKTNLIEAINYDARIDYVGTARITPLNIFTAILFHEGRIEEKAINQIQFTTDAGIYHNVVKNIEDLFPPESPAPVIFTPRIKSEFVQLTLVRLRDDEIVTNFKS